MIKKTVTTAFLLLTFMTFCRAQDITGSWSGKIMDQFDVTYTFKVDGDKVTGNTTGPDGNVIVLQNCVLKDGNLSFSMAMMGNDLKVTGKVKDDSITLTMPGPNGGDPMSVLLKKNK